MANLASIFRPHTFEEVIGQDNTVTILQNQLQTGDTKNAYLFVGPAGCGKTTTARILANQLNGGPKGIVEIDGASNNGIENIRNLIEDARFKPMDTEYKVYVIDECHAISGSAWQAMLKILEEPPKYVVFILCTTDPQKIPATILSRCQRFDYKKVPTNLLVERLSHIIKTLNTKDGCQFDVHEDAINYIATLAEGGVRKAISLLDTCLSYNDVLTQDDIRQILGTADHNVMLSLLLSINNKQEVQTTQIINSLYEGGKDLKLFLQQFMEYLVEIEKYYLLKSADGLSIPTMYLEHFDSIKIDTLAIYKSIQHIYQQVKYETNIRYIVEGELMLLCR